MIEMNLMSNKLDLLGMFYKSYCKKVAKNVSSDEKVLCTFAGRIKDSKGRKLSLLVSITDKKLLYRQGNMDISTVHYKHINTVEIERTLDGAVLELVLNNRVLQFIIPSFLNRSKILAVAMEEINNQINCQQ